MIVVLSDLHFSEAQSTQIGGLRLNRNIPPEVFRGYFSEVNNFAKANNIQSIDLVLAGDILEISRSGLWFQGQDRPYISNGDVFNGSSTEATILKIINAIAQEDKVQETLDLFHNIQEIFHVPVSLHYILGNHDRLVNATPAIRARVREIFGLDDSGEPFKHQLVFYDHKEKPFCFVRHGHEYDSSNFSLRVDQLDEIPIEFPDEAYDASCLGDITSVEFGAALPYLFIQQYGTEEILNSKKLKALYRRLIEFDDVRPTSALLSFLFSTPGVKKRKTWALMKPCFGQILTGLKNNKQFKQELKNSAVLSQWKKVLLLGILNMGFFNAGGPYWMVKNLMKLVSKKIKLDSQVKWAVKENLIQNYESGLKCVVSGHTHTPEVALISAKHGQERYYINTGTWRNNILSTSDFKEFGHLKATTKVLIFRPNEISGSIKKTPWSLHFLSGESYGNYHYL